MAHQSLYRRYRPQRFSEVRGQDHVVSALRSAVADERVGHAYLFSGPRGTGKTSTARILAKALNCEDLRDGEPCGACAACQAMQAGTSYDLQELDAASNNKVEDVRALVERVSLGSPGRTKVYILDEVHMLSAGASNALLKTLEEPPDHVVFVLATTDPQKVLPTIRSRTQHFEFHLLPAEELADHVRWVISDAGLAVDDAGIEHVLRAGGGSARDTLSALDQVAAGGVSSASDHAERLAEAIVATDVALALSTVADATVAGRDPRVLGEALLAHLRDVFLHRMGGPQDHLSEVARAQVEGWAGRISDRAVTRALEEVGEALLAMRQAPDPRIPLEVALVRITRPAEVGAADDGALAALVARVERLEQSAGTAMAGAPAPGGSAASSPAAAPSVASGGREPAPAPAASGRPGDAARAALAAKGGGRPTRAAASAPPPPSAAAPPPSPAAPPPSPAVPPPSPATAPAPAADAPPPAADPPPPAAPPVSAAQAPEPSPATSGASTAAPDPAADVGQVARVWTDEVLPRLSGLTKALFAVGAIVGAEGDTVTVGLPNDAHRERAAQKRADAEAALATAMGRPITLRLAVHAEGVPVAPSGGSGGAGPSAARPAPVDEPEEHIDLDALVDAPTETRTGVERVTEAFPGAQIVDDVR